MNLTQQKLREMLLQLLYSYDKHDSAQEEMVALFSRELSVPEEAVRTAFERMQLVRFHLEAIDEKIAGAAKEFSFKRIQPVEKNILRLAVYELCDDPAIPPKVAIAEAVRLARKFASPQAADFINGVLDTVWKENEVSGE